VDSAPSKTETVAAVDFSVRLARSGLLLPVPPDRSIVEVLREAGIDVATSCEAGLCATCKTRYLDGTPEHQDFILNDEERKSFVTICCARATSDVLVLDL
jgi:vanillate O-demethylase ferredoxin subunit